MTSMNETELKAHIEWGRKLLKKCSDIIAFKQAEIEQYIEKQLTISFTIAHYSELLEQMKKD